MDMEDRVHELLDPLPRRAGDRHDRRAFHLLLTDKGKTLSQMHENIHRRIAEHFTHALDDHELHQFARLLNKALKSAFS